MYGIEVHPRMNKLPRRRRPVTLEQLAAGYTTTELHYQLRAAESHHLDTLVAVLRAELERRAQSQAETQKAAPDEPDAA